MADMARVRQSQCGNCMVHSGYEAAVSTTLRFHKGFAPDRPKQFFFSKYETKERSAS